MPKKTKTKKQHSMAHSLCVVWCTSILGAVHIVVNYSLDLNVYSNKFIGSAVSSVLCNKKVTRAEKQMCIWWKMQEATQEPLFFFLTGPKTADVFDSKLTSARSIRNY